MKACLCLLLCLVSVNVLAASKGRQALATSVLRVCADPDNLPFSSKDLTGFENRIIDIIATRLDRKVKYTWYPQTTGFVRNTLRLRECDLISGITTSSELVQNTNPYYQSAYAMVYRQDSGITATSISDPELRDKTLGVVAGTPPATVIAQQGLLGNVKPYQLTVDTRHDKPTKQAMQDVDSGEVDAVFIWGPIAAWHARSAENELVVVPLVGEERKHRMNFRVSMAVRYAETDWKRLINSVLKDSQEDINAVLREYDVPLLNDRGELLSN